jgi:hypothetical protein
MNVYVVLQKPGCLLPMELGWVCGGTSRLEWPGGLLWMKPGWVCGSECYCHIYDLHNIAEARLPVSEGARLGIWWYLEHTTQGAKGRYCTLFAYRTHCVQGVSSVVQTDLIVEIGWRRKNLRLSYAGVLAISMDKGA